MTKISTAFKTYSIIKRKPQFGKHHRSQVLKAMTSNVFDIARFCLYPQELVLLMREPIRVRKLQLLSHQFMICKCSLLLALLWLVDSL